MSHHPYILCYFAKYAHHKTFNVYISLFQPTTRFLPCSAAIQFHDITYTITCHTDSILLSSNCVVATHNPMHAHQLHTQPLPNPLPFITLLCTRQNGTRCRDGVKVLWWCSHFVLLLFEGSIPTCEWENYMPPLKLHSLPLFISLAQSITTRYGLNLCNLVLILLLI